ncbi:MAG: WGR domain-containing protein [Pseudomonadota bacterium]
MQIDLARIDPDVNMDRFYHVQLTAGLFDVAGVERIWGRRGTRGRHRVDWYETQNEAISAMYELVSRKKARGYVEVCSVV